MSMEEKLAAKETFNGILTGAFKRLDIRFHEMARNTLQATVS